MLRGRTEELAKLTTAVDARRPVVLVGPAGVGKTSLASVALEGQGAFRVAGALATQQWSPMQLFRRLLGSAVAEDPSQVAAAVLRVAPGALLLDDLQWADPLALDAIAQLVGRLPLVATLRTGDPGASFALACLEAAGFERHALGPLPVVVSRDLLDELAPQLSESRRGEILTQAGGNPLLLQELAQGGPESPSLLSALHARLADLPSSAQLAMERLSVLGRPCDPDLLGPGATDLVTSGLALLIDGLVRVRHDLLAEVVVEDLGDRAGDVRRSLAALVPGDEGAFLLAASGDAVGARRLALAAAVGTSSAVRAELLDLAVSCAPEGDLDVGNRLVAARAMTWSGQHERALALATPDGLDALAPLDRGHLLAAAAEAAWHARRTDDFARHVRAALADLEGSDTEAEVEVLAGSTIIETRIQLDGTPALDRAHRAVALADRLGTKRGFARWRLASVLMTSGGSGWVEAYRDAVTAARDEQDHFAMLSATEGLMLGQWMAGSIDDAADTAEEFFLTGQAGHEDHALLTHAALGSILALVAARDREQLVDRWAPILVEHQVFRNRHYVEAAVALALADLGRHDEAGKVLDAARARPIGEPQAASITVWAIAEVAYLSGRAAQATEAVHRAAELGVPGFPAAVAAQLVGCFLAFDECRPPGCPEPATAMPGWRAASLDWQGVAAAADGRFEDAVGCFDDASRSWQGHDRRYQMRSAWAAADCARRAGLAGAKDRLAAIEDDARRLQLTALVERTRWSQRRLGVARGADRSAGVAGLTARQEQVLARVGAGLTTAEIAAELRVTPSTVETTIRSAVQRLGVANRKAAAARLAEGDAIATSSP